MDHKSHAMDHKSHAIDHKSHAMDHNSHAMVHNSHAMDHNTHAMVHKSHLQVGIELLDVSEVVYLRLQSHQLLRHHLQIMHCSGESKHLLVNLQIMQ